MKTNRLEAFSDGVLAIVITIMVLEMQAPEGAGWEALKPVIPKFISYILSFIYVGITGTIIIIYFKPYKE